MPPSNQMSNGIVEFSVWRSFLNTMTWNYNVLLEDKNAVR
jgi:hypothetical protein